VLPVQMNQKTVFCMGKKVFCVDLVAVCVTQTLGFFGEMPVDIVVVGGSIPLAPTKLFNDLAGIFVVLFGSKEPKAV